jgi:hypothetical protein
VKPRSTTVSSSYIRTRVVHQNSHKRKRRVKPIPNPSKPLEEIGNLLEGNIKSLGDDSGSDYDGRSNNDDGPNYASGSNYEGRSNYDGRSDYNGGSDREDRSNHGGRGGSDYDGRFDHDNGSHYDGGDDGSNCNDSDSNDEFNIPNRRSKPTFEGAYGPYYPTYTAAAFSIFLSTSGLSRTDFDTLLKILKHPEFRVAELPSSYKACKQLQAGLPTLPVHTQKLPIDKEHSHVTKDTSSSAYHHSIGDIVHRIISTPSLWKNLYFGPGMKVANSSEFWHGTIWRESALFGAESVCANGR